MDRPIQTRIDHLDGKHHGEEETAATLGCAACYRLVGLGESAPRGRFDAEPPRPRWTQRANLKDFTAFVPAELN